MDGLLQDAAVIYKVVVGEKERIEWGSPNTRRIGSQAADRYAASVRELLDPQSKNYGCASTHTCVCAHATSRNGIEHITRR